MEGGGGGVDSGSGEYMPVLLVEGGKCYLQETWGGSPC